MRVSGNAFRLLILKFLFFWQKTSEKFSRFNKIDRIFIEMFTDNWRVKAGDILLQNSDSYFMPIAKQIAGLRVEADINENIKLES